MDTKTKINLKGVISCPALLGWTCTDGSLLWVKLCLMTFPRIRFLSTSQACTMLEQTFGSSLAIH